MSDLFPHIREQMDDICLIRSMQSSDNEHYQATRSPSTPARSSSPAPASAPGLSYGLGTMNSNLPSFIVLARSCPYAGTLVYANDFLPAYHQGFGSSPERRRSPASTAGRRSDAFRSWSCNSPTRLNEQHRERHPGQRASWPRGCGRSRPPFHHAE